ncbi:MAG: hypothetical protein JSV56_13530, partial [Methanomassiliicoccales archaeon]
TFTAHSKSVPYPQDYVEVNTSVKEAFVLNIDIEGGYKKTSSIDPPDVTNYTLTLKNKGNVNVTITLKHTAPKAGWEVAFPPKYFNGKVTLDKAYYSNRTEAVENVNITISAPSNAQPAEMMIIEIWGEKEDEGWTSPKITITTIVKTILAVTFNRDITVGNVTSAGTFFNFTIENSGNKDVLVDFEMEKDYILDVYIAYTQLIIKTDQDPRKNSLIVSTAADAPLGNYTINLTAWANETNELIGSTEFYYIIVPELNITDIAVSVSEPLQYKTVTLTATIENVGYVDATDVTVRFYDGSKKIGEVHLDSINATESAIAEIDWTPSDFGNRSIRVAIDVAGVGNFSSHGIDISEEIQGIDVKINWQPYYLIIYVIIVVILAAAVISSIFGLRYGGAIPHLNHYAETSEEGAQEEYPEELPDEEPQLGVEEEDKRPFGAYGMTPEPRERRDERWRDERRDERREERARRPPPERISEPYKKESAPPREPEDLKVENELKVEMSRVQEQLDKTKSFGVDTTNIDQLLKTAKKSLSDGNHNKAKQYLGYASERLKNLMAKRDEAISAIKEAKEVLSGMRGTTDLTIVENFLVKADSLLKEGDFREAINYAKKAKDRAVRLQRREMRL